MVLKFLEAERSLPSRLCLAFELFYLSYAGNYQSKCLKSVGTCLELVRGGYTCALQPCEEGVIESAKGGI